MIGMFIAKFLPFIPVAAEGSTTMANVVKWGGGICGGLMALFLLISLTKDVFAMIKGSGDASLFKIIGKVATVIIILVITVMVINYGAGLAENPGSDQDGLMNTGKNLLEQGMNQVDKATGEIFEGTTTGDDGGDGGEGGE